MAFIRRRNSIEQDKNKIGDVALLSDAVKKVLEANPNAVADYKNGKEASFQFLIGMVMRETKGKADADVVKKLLIKNLV